MTKPIRISSVIIAIILGANLSYGAASYYFQKPDATTLPDNGRILLYDPATSSDKNITGATLKSTMQTIATDTAPQACVDIFDGAAGATGPQGPAGNNGKTVLSGQGAPGLSTGTDGDYYVDLLTYYLYGPKATGVWPAGISLVGPEGPEGPPGPPGTVDQATILSQIALPGGNPLSRQPLTPQDDTTCMFEMRDTSPGNLRLCITGDGTILRKDANGTLREKWQPDYTYVKYRGDGVTIAMRNYSSGRQEHYGQVVIR
jgi:hypothetical protein